MQGMILKRKLMIGLAVLAAAICLINCLIAAILYREMRERRDSGAVCEAARTAALCLDADGLDIESYLNSLKGSPEVGNLYILTLEERELRCSQASGEAQKEIDSEQKVALETALAAFCSEGRLVIQHEGGRKSRTAAFVPLVGSDGRAVGLVMAETSMESVIRDTRRFCLYFLTGSIPVMALSCLLYFRLLSREIISPFDRLRRMTQEEQECRLSAAAAREESGQDRGEMGQLTAAVEQMAEECHACRQQLDHLNRERERYETEQRTRNVLQADLLAAVFPFNADHPDGKTAGGPPAWKKRRGWVYRLFHEGRDPYRNHHSADDGRQVSGCRPASRRENQDKGWTDVGSGTPGAS